MKEWKQEKEENGREEKLIRIKRHYYKDKKKNWKKYEKKKK